MGLADLVGCRFPVLDCVLPEFQGCVLLIPPCLLGWLTPWRLLMSPAWEELISPLLLQTMDPPAPSLTLSCSFP